MLTSAKVKIRIIYRQLPFRHIYFYIKSLKFAFQLSKLTDYDTVCLKFHLKLSTTDICLIHAEIFCNFCVNPSDQLRHAGVHAWYSFLAAADAPGHDTGLDVLARVLLAGAGQRGATVSHTRVHARLAASTREGGVQAEPAAQARAAQSRLARAVGHHRQVHLLHHVLEAAAVEAILAEAGGHAGRVVEVLAVLGKTQSADVLFQLDGFFQEEEGDVVTQVDPVEAAVSLHANHTVLLVRQRFKLGLGVPVSQTDTEAAHVLPERHKAVM